MRIVFMGTPEFSVPALNQLVDAGHEVVAVYCQPARPAGRGKKDRPSAVELRARELGIDVLTPISFRDKIDVERFAAHEADIAVVVAYGLILPEAILNAPKFGCLNIHASLLPRWRGAAPIHRAIMAGDKATGICIMAMDAGLDTGDVILRMETQIGQTETTSELHDRLSQLGGQAIVQALADLPSHPHEPQSDVGITYARKIDKAEAHVDWSRPAIEIDRLIRGLSVFPGAWTNVGGARVKLLKSALADGSGGSGEVLEGWTVACGDGAVEILECQMQGKRKVSAREFLNGFDMPSRLE